MAPLLLFLFLQVLAIVLVPSCAQAQPNITLGSSLTPDGPNTSWLSPSGDFAFGFRQLETDSSIYLLAIWFDKIAAKTVVWYATSNEPVLVPSGSNLHLTADGILSLHHANGSEVWNPAVTGVAYASMLDTGNFMLVGTDGSTKWQSFDAPTDTMLPSQVLHLGKNLQARLMDTDYSDGRFVLAVQTDGNLVFYLVAVPSRLQYDAYWSTNTVGNGSQLVFNATGKIYYALKNGTQLNITNGMVDSTADFYHRATLDPDGVFRQYVYPQKAAVNSGWTGGWTALDFRPQNICQAITTDVGSGACGFNSICTFNWNQSVDCICPPQYSFIDVERKYKGCKPDFMPQSCDLDDTAALQQFDLIPMYGVDWPLADYEQYISVGEDECRNLCLTDCFCAVTVFDQGNCWKKKFPLSNGKMGSDVTRTVLLKVPKSSNSQSQLSSDSDKWKKDKKYWILGSSVLLGGSIVVNLVLIAALLLGTYCTVNRKKKQQPQPQQSLAGGLPLTAFTYRELEEATDEFREELGRGASGVVYKGHLQDEFSTCVAVKKIDKHLTTSKQTDKLLPEMEKEFAVEVQTIGRTFHKNLVRLLGFCNEGTERLLVYEFMSNGSLTGFLFSDVRPHWNLRVQVALGVARGLLYLHEECSTQIIHCDIKPQNILLDDNLVAKISDFGLAKLLLTDQTQTTTGIRGTRGYVAPEWFKNIGITAKVDVYSFGVILLELVCCRRNVEPNIVDEDRTILTYWANDCYRFGRLDLLVEGDEEAVFDLKRVERFVAVALWCVLEEPAMRPTMLKVTQMLDGSVPIPAPPDLSSYISSIQ